MWNSLKALALILLASPALAADKIVAAADIGSKGTKFIVVKIVNGPNGPVFERIYNKTADPTPLAGAGADQTLTAEGIKRTVDVVEEFVKIARTEHKLADADIHLLASSGVALAPNKDAFANAVMERVKLPVAFVAPNDEAIWLFRGLVPKDKRSEVVVIDIGSGTSRVVGSGSDNGRVWYVTGLLPLGTVSLTNKAAAAVKANNSKYDDELTKLRVGLSKEVSDAAEGNPTLVHHRRKVHLCGGSAWAATTILFPEKVKEPFVKLTPADFDHYAKLLAEGKGAFPAVDLSKITDAKIKADAEKELQRVKDTFTVENLKVGAAILQELAKAYKLDNKEATFARDAIFGWVLGHMMGD